MINCTENSKMPSNDDSTSHMKEVFEAIADELIEDCMLDACFRVHRAVKLGYFPLEEYIITEDKFEIYDPTKMAAVEFSKEIYGHTDSSKKKTIAVLCPNCNKKVGSLKYAGHLNTCLNNGGRSVRAQTKTRKYMNSDLNSEDDSGSDDYMKSKKKPRKKSKKVGIRKNVLSDSSSTFGNLFELPYDKRQDFLNKFCGVNSKRTGKPCMNTHNCSQHDDEQKLKVQELYLNNGGQFKNQIEPDTTVTPESSVPTSLRSRSSSPGSTSGQSGAGQEEENFTSHSHENLLD